MLWTRGCWRPQEWVPHRSMMGTLIACGTEGRGPAHHTFCALPALCHLPAPTEPGVSAQTPRHLESPHSSTFSSSDSGDKPAAVQRAAALSISICLGARLVWVAGSEAACVTQDIAPAVLEWSQPYSEPPCAGPTHSYL